ncbi:MAG: glutaredoxin family protein [Gammaproteobacteria bacterium]|nr:glutaredoxin family protein [Gammaproteobacteria bacterium]MDP2139204.1 glutaredoxin family protein [Gammaproteobacteria bacterium]MDP2349027.1 glutaredoxin family protein [Gammaproteobacteria bacterium]
MKVLFLYTTLGCHLCEQAEQLLAPVVDYINRCGDEQSQVVVRLVEIAESNELMLLHGLRIPVIKLQGTEPELSWPFEQAQVFEFITRQL